MSAEKVIYRYSETYYRQKSICDVKFNEFGETCELIYGKLIGYLIYGKYIST